MSGGSASASGSGSGIRQAVERGVRTVLLYPRCACFMVPWLVYLLVANLFLSALLPLSALFPNAAYHASSACAAGVWLAIQRIFTRLNRARIVVSGVDALPPRESAIVVANHVEWCDFYMIQELALHCGVLGRCRYFAKQQLKWVPFLGWGLWAMGMPLVSRKWTDDRREMERVFHGVVERAWPMWLVSYSEATRFTPAKRKEAERWCHANGKALGKHLLYPRTKGFIASVQKLRKAAQVKAVYDVTLAYADHDKLFQHPPTFLQTLYEPRLYRRWRFYVHVDRYELQQLPHDDVGLAKWLEDRWVEKGERLEGLRDRLSKNLPWESDAGPSQSIPSRHAKSQ